MSTLVDTTVGLLGGLAVGLGYYWAETLAAWLIKRALAKVLAQYQIVPPEQIAKDIRGRKRTTDGDG